MTPGEVDATKMTSAEKTGSAITGAVRQTGSKAGDKASPAAELERTATA